MASKDRDKGPDIHGWAKGPNAKRKAKPAKSKKSKPPAKRKSADRDVLDPPDSGSGKSSDTRVNSYGQSIRGVLAGTTHLDHLINATDYVGFEMFYCRFTQRTCIRRIEPNRDPTIIVMDDPILITAWSEIVEHCCTLKPSRKAGAEPHLEPAQFNWRTYDRLAKSFGAEALHRMPHRVENRVVTLFEEFCDVGNKADGEFVANWFLDEWGAVADGEAERELVRHLTIRLGVNILDRAFRLGRKLKSWPVLLGPTNLGKSQFVRNILPLSIRDAGFHGQALSLSKSRDEIVRKLSGELVVEIPELADVQATQIEHLKDLLDMSTESARILYDSWEREFNVTCALIGTANPERPVLPSGADPALILRLPLIELTTSPWGNDVPVDEQLDADDQALRKRLWRGWRYWYEVAKFDPVQMPNAEMRDLILERAKPFTYIDSGSSELVSAAHRILKSYIDNPDKSHPIVDSLFDEGVMATDLIAFLPNAEYRVPMPRNPSVRLGQALGNDDDWIKVSESTKGNRWTCLSLTKAKPSMIVTNSAVEYALREHDIESGGGDAPDTEEEPF